MRLKECPVCGVEYAGERACSAGCISAYHREYQSRTIEAQCSVCGEWRPLTYSRFVNCKNRRGGACDNCPPGDRKNAQWRNIIEPEGVEDIVWIKAQCKTCRHGVPEPVAWTGYKCLANAVVCQPRLFGRLYVRR